MICHFCHQDVDPSDKHYDMGIGHEKCELEAAMKARINYLNHLVGIEPSPFLHDLFTFQGSTSDTRGINRLSAAIAIITTALGSVHLSPTLDLSGLCGCSDKETVY